jgi:hypothetical protein
MLGTCRAQQHIDVFFCAIRAEMFKRSPIEEGVL